MKADLGLWADALKLCFGSSEEGAAPPCQATALALLQRLSAESAEFAGAVKEAVAAAAPELPGDSPLLAI